MTREGPSARTCFWLLVSYGVMYYGMFAHEAVQKHDRVDLGMALGGFILWEGMICLIAWAERR